MGRNAHYLLFLIPFSSACPLHYFLFIVPVDSIVVNIATMSSGGYKRSRSPSPASAEAAPKKARVLGQNPLEWSVDDVVYWAINVVKIDEKHAKKLAMQEIKGTSLSEMTEEKFMADGIPRGPAAELIKEIRHLFPSSPPSSPGAPSHVTLLPVSHRRGSTLLHSFPYFLFLCPCNFHHSPYISVSSLLEPKLLRFSPSPFLHTF